MFNLFQVSASRIRIRNPVGNNKKHVLTKVFLTRLSVSEPVGWLLLRSVVLVGMAATLLLQQNKVRYQASFSMLIYRIFFSSSLIIMYTSLHIFI